MINDETLSKLERLSMLEIIDKDSTRAHLEEILGFIDNLKNLECKEIQPDNTLHTPLRDDNPHDDGISKAILSNAPKSDGDFFIVPKIIE